MPRSTLSRPALALLLALPACTPTPPQASATAAQPSAARQTVHVAPEPADANCTVRQGADTYTGVTAADALTVDRAAPLDILCRKPGFRPLHLTQAPAVDFAAPQGQQIAFPDVIPVELQPARAR